MNRRAFIAGLVLLPFAKLFAKAEISDRFIQHKTDDGTPVVWAGTTIPVSERSFQMMGELKDTDTHTFHKEPKEPEPDSNLITVHRYHSSWQHRFLYGSKEEN